jgi:hypothetical protein
MNDRTYDDFRLDKMLYPANALKHPSEVAEEYPGRRAP